MEVSEARINSIERRLAKIDFEQKSQARELRTVHDYMQDLRIDIVQRFDDIDQWRDKADQRLENIEKTLVTLERKLDEVLIFLRSARGTEPQQ